MPPPVEELFARQLNALREGLREVFPLPFTTSRAKLPSTVSAGDLVDRLVPLGSETLPPSTSEVLEVPAMRIRFFLPSPSHSLSSSFFLFFSSLFFSFFFSPFSFQ
jgi:hypothetical protein